MITTQSGEYTLEEYREKEKALADAFKKFWKNEIDKNALEKAKKDSGFSYCEIKNVQYDASFED